MSEVNNEVVKSRYDHLEKLRKDGNALDKQAEFKLIQKTYSEGADTYDQNMEHIQYQGPVHVVNEIELLYPDNKDIRILDYGCGTGQVAIELVKRGYTNIDGLDPNKESTEVARRKGVLKKIFNMKNDDDLSCIGLNVYDVVCSSGVFFLSSSFPGYKDVVRISKLVKQGGYIVNVTGYQYLKSKCVDRTPIAEAEERGVLKAFPDKILPGYRATNEGKVLDAVALIYQIY